MGIIFAVLIVAITGCAERDTTNPADFSGESFTLQLRESEEDALLKEGNNKSKTRLVVCQGKTCRNPLLKAGGDEYLFDDSYSVYKKGQKDTGKRLRTALLWGSLLAGLSSVWFYIKSDQTRKVLARKYEEMQTSIKKLHKIDGNIAKLEGKESLTTNAFYASEIALVSTALASIVTSNRNNNSSDGLQQKLANLLVHKQPVHVTRSELKHILNHITELVPAVVENFTKKHVVNS